MEEEAKLLRFWKIYWCNYSYSLMAALNMGQPIRSRFWCIRKTFKSIDDGPVGWIEKLDLLEALFLYAVLERTTMKNWH